MNGTDQFTRTIAEYLNQRAMKDPLFAPNLMKPNKNIEESASRTFLMKCRKAVVMDLRMMKSIQWRYTTMMKTI